MHQIVSIEKQLLQGYCPNTIEKWHHFGLNIYKVSIDFNVSTRGVRNKTETRISNEFYSHVLLLPVM